MVLLSTLALGIHWGGDVVAGTAVGFISVALAHRLAHAPTPVTVAHPMATARHRRRPAS
jgi:membrane-associated phospholipid phosphatase